MIQNDDRESAIWWSWWRMAPSGRHSFAYFMPEQKISICRERCDRTWFLMPQKEETNIINATRGRSPLNFWMDHTSQATGAFTWQCSRLNDPPRDRIKEQLEKPMLFVLPFAQLNHFFPPPRVWGATRKPPVHSSDVVVIVAVVCGKLD